MPGAKKTPSDPVSVVQRQLDAYNAHDLESFLAEYAEDVVVYDQSTGEVRIRGMAVMRERYAKRLETPGLHADAVSRMTVGDFVIDYEVVTQEPEPKLSKAVAIYEVKQGRMARMWFAK